MTKKLEELLNLPDSQDIINASKATKAETALVDQKETKRDIAEFDKISSALPSVKGLGEKADTELNEIADKAMTAYDELMDLGMNGRVFEVAGGMLKTSLDAKVAKLNNKLKIVELQLKKEKQDKDGNPESQAGIVNGAGYVVTDRNSLIEKLKGMSEDK